MATAADSPIINTSMTMTATNQLVKSPQGRRGETTISSPWTQIVRGESEIAANPSSVPAVIEQAVAVSASSSPSSMAEDDGGEDGNGSNINAGKKPAWNKPSSGGAVEIEAVMGDSWPALSASARATAKSSSDSLKSLSDGVSSVSIPQTQVSGNTNATSTPNHTVPIHQRSMKRYSSSNGGSTQQPISQGPAGEVHLNNASPRDHAQGSSQSRGINGFLPHQRNSLRNSNGGLHLHGDGVHSHNHRGRRDQDPGNHNWNSHRNYNGRDARMQPRRVVPRYIRYPPPPPPPPPFPTFTPFIPPPQVQPFGTPMGFHDSIRGVPFFAASLPPHPVFLPPPDLQLHSRIVNQIDYYFSNENLVKDIFLRQNMDDHGWVPVRLIAGFRKVSLLTDNIQSILGALRSSTVVEVQGDKVRRRNDWMRWIMAPSVQFPNVSGPPIVNSTQDMLSNHVQSMSLDEKITGCSTERSQDDSKAETHLGRSTSGDLSSQSQPSISEEMGKVSVEGGLDRPTSARN